MNPFTMTMIIVDSAAAQTAIITGARGPNFAPVSACAAGADGIGMAYELILRGDAQVMMCGGSEATVTGLGIASFDRLGTCRARMKTRRRPAAHFPLIARGR